MAPRTPHSPHGHTRQVEHTTSRQATHVESKSDAHRTRTGLAPRQHPHRSVALVSDIQPRKRSSEEQTTPSKSYRTPAHTLAAALANDSIERCTGAQPDGLAWLALGFICFLCNGFTFY